MNAEEMLEKIKPYWKHNIYHSTINTGVREGYYKVEGCFVKIPASAKWKVVTFEGFKNGIAYFSHNKGEIIVLELEDEEHKMSLMLSFLTKDEAKELANKLLNAIEQN